MRVHFASRMLERCDRERLIVTFADTGLTVVRIEEVSQHYGD